MNRGVQEVLARLELRGCKPRRSHDGWEARCPAHEDHKPSLSVTEAPDGKVLVRCHRGCRFEDIASALGLRAQDFFPDNTEPRSTTIERVYAYTDETGALLFEVVRFHPKAFRQRRPDGAQASSYRFSYIEHRGGGDGARAQRTPIGPTQTNK
jgi:hypothetical protein